MATDRERMMVPFYAQCRRLHSRTEASNDLESTDLGYPDDFSSRRSESRCLQACIDQYGRHWQTTSNEFTGVVVIFASGKRVCRQVCVSSVMTRSGKIARHISANGFRV